MGLIEDNDNRNELAKLTRWFTTKHTDTYTSLDEYVARMKPDQKQIYYITGETKAKAMASPALERLRKLDYEVRHPCPAQPPVQFQAYMIRPSSCSGKYSNAFVP